MKNHQTTLVSLNPYRDLTTFKAPLYVAWEITHRCNAKCLHCYSSSGPDAATDPELNTREALSVIEQLAEAGVLMLAFSGGEPILRKDWEVLVGHAAGHGLGTNVGTNGSTVSAPVARRLKDLGVRSVTVSIDSHESEVHDRFRQLPGLFRKATTAVRLLADAGVRVVVGFTPTKINWRHGHQVIDLAQRLGAAAVNLSEYVPAGRGTTDLALSPVELREVLEEWIGYRDRYKDSIQIIWHDCRVGMLAPASEKRNYLGCGAGRLVARICPDGTVTPCVFLPDPIGSLKKRTFREVWAGSSLMAQFRQRSGYISGNCGECEHLNTCGGCRAVARAYSGGNALAGDPHCWVKEESTSKIQGLPDGESLPI